MKNIVYILSVCILLIISCKKKNKNSIDDNSQTQGTTTGVNVPPPPNLIINVPHDANGVLMASRVPYNFGSFTTLVGNASAFFYTSPSDYNYQDAGVVKCNDSILMKQSGSYYFGGKAINFQTYSGINYTAGSLWNVTGNEAPAINYTITSFPTDANMTSSNLLYKNATYTLTFNGANNSDSVAVYLGCDSQMVKKTIGATTYSVSFTGSEVASTKKHGSTNKGFFNIIPYSLQSASFSSKKYYFINASTSTWTVTIQ
jgi:hypothetical protein